MHTGYNPQISSTYNFPAVGTAVTAANEKLHTQTLSLVRRDTSLLYTVRGKATKLQLKKVLLHSQRLFNLRFYTVNTLQLIFSM